MKQYSDFLASKTIWATDCGLVRHGPIHPMLFAFQRDLCSWALRKGRAAIFADTGLGKTLMQLEWARLLDVPTLIIAPLTVARQTAAEGGKLGLSVRYVRHQHEVLESDRLLITNYDMVQHFKGEAFGAVVLDESSILKAVDGKTRQRLTDMFARTKYRLCCTATPAPNDIAEISNHSEFLGIMTRADMLATFFVHDDEGWRMRGHAEAAFFQWMTSWSMSIKFPSDLGYKDDGFILPPLSVEPEWVETKQRSADKLFFTGLGGIADRSKVRKSTLHERVSRAVGLVLGRDGQWLCWCGLNEEGRQLHAAVPDSVLMEGQDAVEKKTKAIQDFQDGKTRVLITKPTIAGFGLNLQNCNQMVFLGLSDSWESYYQCIRRCYRFGQTSPVTARIILSDLERQVYANVMSKQDEAERMSRSLIAAVSAMEKEALGEMENQTAYLERETRGEGYRLLLGDSAERMKAIESDSVGLSVFSPPFISLYTYSPTPRDVGNSRSKDEFFEHFGFIIRELLRVTQPGRNCCCHVAQVPAMLAKDGYIGLKDFRGMTIEAFQAQGWIYHGEVCIDKDPQAQAIRTHSKGLLFVQMKKDATWLRPALADYVLVFRKPGDNAEPVHPDIDNEKWIEWARPIWYGIRESDTLNVLEARSETDDRHICPLQLETIRRCICLWSNPGNLVCSPFAGIGSEGYVALELDREFVGIELKEEYFRVAERNLRKALNKKAESMSLFAGIAAHA